MNIEMMGYQQRFADSVLEHGYNYSVSTELNSQGDDNWVGIAVLVGLLCLAAYVFYRFLRWVFAWFLVGAEIRAGDLISDFDSAEEDLCEIFTDRVHPEGTPVVMRKIRVRAHRLKKMAFSVANDAYFQFGYREASEANKLITRKFMRDALSGLKDLRRSDANQVIDMALPLSFLPSRTMKDMAIIVNTDTFLDRQSLESVGWWGSLPRFWRRPTST